MQAKQNWKLNDGKPDVYFAKEMFLPGYHSSVVGGDYQEFSNQFEKDYGRKRLSKILRAHSYGSHKYEAYEVPSVYNLEEKPRKNPYPDAMLILNAIQVVTERMMRLIERLDPGVHQFFPIQFINKDKTPVEENFFVLVVTEKKPTVHPEDAAIQTGISTSLMDGTERPYRRLLEPNGPGSPPLHVLESAASGPHIWRDAEFTGSLFISHVLADEIKAMKARFFKTFACRTVNEEGMPA